MALYATDIAPQQVSDFYGDYLQHSDWSYGGHWEGQDNGRVMQWGLNAHWLFDQASQQEKQFMFLAERSTDTSELCYSPKEATVAAMAAGQTVYIIQIVYTQDKTTNARECPPGVVGNHENEWWDINIP